MRKTIAAVAAVAFVSLVAAAWPVQAERAPATPAVAADCCDQNVPLSQRGTNFPPDALVAALPPAAALPAPTGAPDAIAPAWPIPPPRALHVLQCVWLC